MVVNARNVGKLELIVDVELLENVFDNAAAEDMAEVFNDERVLEKDKRSEWNYTMTEKLNENGRKHIKRLYDMVCDWYEKHPEDAEAEGYMKW